MVGALRFLLQVKKYRNISIDFWFQRLITQFNAQPLDVSNLNVKDDIDAVKSAKAHVVYLTT